MPVQGGSRTSFGSRQPAAGATFCARAGVLVALLLAPVRSTASPVEVEIDGTHESCHVTGGFSAPVPAAIAWQVLCDYDHIPQFVPSMVSSRSERRDGELIVTQVARAGFLFFHKNVRVELDVIEQPMQQIVFQDRLRRDFVDYWGSWTIGADSTGTRIDYSLGAEPRAALARALCRSALKRTAYDLLMRVREEMMKRAASAPEHRAPDR